MVDIITFGSATWDIYITPEDLSLISSKDFLSGKAIAFNLGSKINLTKTEFSIGGGGVNTAFTFRRQGFKVAYLGCLGYDSLGSEIISRLKKNNIKTSLIQRTDKASTNSSLIFNVKGLDRTIMVYRGASEYLTNIKFKKAKWYYLAPLSGKIANLTQNIIDYASENKIKVAFNPGNSQLSLPRKTLQKMIDKTDILILNKEEASILTKKDYHQEKEIIEELQKIHKKTTIMTKGEEGVVVLDNNNIYDKEARLVKALDKTGAGDAFGSGFVSGLIKFNQIEKAIDLGLRNSASCVKKLGSTKGLL